jgi:CBS domain-containing protein
MFTESDAAGFDRFTQLQNVVREEIIAVEPDTRPEEIYERLSGQRLSVAPVVDATADSSAASPARVRCGARSTRRPSIGTVG